MSDCDCKGITLFRGTNGDYVRVTPEPAGPNCPDGGIKVEIVSGTDDTTILDTQYVCDGAQGAQGGQGIPGLPGTDGADGQDGQDGADGQGIDHVSFTSSTGGGGAGQEGETDTYTVWGDVGETINLGTFLVYNGADGAGGGGALTFKRVYDPTSASATYNVSFLDGGTTARPNHTYYIEELSQAGVPPQNVILQVPYDGSENGGFPPAVGDEIELIIGNRNGWAVSTNPDIQIGTGASAFNFVGLWGDPLNASPPLNAYAEIQAPSVLEWSNTVNRAGWYVKLKCVEVDLGTKVLWIVTDYYNSAVDFPIVGP
jgi:hypothetical protein